MARSSLTFVRDFSVKFFFQPIYTDYANFEGGGNHHKIFCSETRAEMICDPRWLPLLSAEILIGNKQTKKNRLKFFYEI
jgi:hypothetical protein